MSEKTPTEIIKKARPNIKDNSVKMYVSNLEKLKKLFKTDNYDFLKDEKKVLEKLDNLSDNTIRNYLNAVLIYLMAVNSKGDLDEEVKIYTDLRDDLNKKYEENQASGKISEKQKENFVDISEIYKMIETMGNEIKDKKIKKKENLTPKDKQ